MNKYYLKRQKCICYSFIVKVLWKIHFILSKDPKPSIEQLKKKFVDIRVVEIILNVYLPSFLVQMCLLPILLSLKLETLITLSEPFYT